MNSRIKLIIGGIALALLLLVGLILYSLAEPENSNETEEITEAQIQRDNYMASKTDPTMATGSDRGFFAAGPSGEEGLQMQLEFYEKWAQYPPFSRPLNEGQVDLLDPYQIRLAPVRVISQPAQGCEQTVDGKTRCQKPPKFSEMQCKMYPERSISVGKDEFKVYLECIGKDGKHLDITGITPRVYTMVYQNSFPSLPPLSYGDNGNNGDETAGDGIYTFVVKPTTNDWGDMFLEVDMNVKGERHNQRTSWFSTPHIVAKFGTNPSDRLANGHLMLDVPVTVYKAGYYSFDANLIGTGEDTGPVASSSWQGKLEKGNQTIPFKFWGKIIRERAVDGPYLVQNIRGRRNNSPVTPDMVQEAMKKNKSITGNHTEPLFEYLEPAQDYKTQAYLSTDFSQEVWDSEEKQRRINFLKSQMRMSN